MPDLTNFGHFSYCLGKIKDPMIGRYYRKGLKPRGHGIPPSGPLNYSELFACSQCDASGRYLPTFDPSIRMFNRDVPLNVI